jgi:hypothetical protein
VEAVRNEPHLSSPSTFDDSAPDSAPLSAGGRASTTSARPAAHRARKRHGHWWIIPVFVLLAAAAVVSILWQPRPATTPPRAAPAVEEPAPPLAPAKPRYPIESTASALPPVDASDATLLAAIQGLFGGSGIGSFLEPRDLARNFVATVDNIPRKTMPPRMLPWRPAAGNFGTRGNGDALAIGEANALRYAPVMKLVNSVSPEAFVALYVRYYPLFQEAYRDLGYPEGHFNDRLVEAIDVLLAAPEPTTPPRLVQPKVFYEYADRNLESLPAGQKLMIRLGRENELALKAKLREIRRLVTAEQVGQPKG